MINRFKSALLNAVSSSAVDDRHLNGHHHNGTSTSSSHTNSKSTSGDSHVVPVKYVYSRPHFLNLQSSDEIQVSADHAVRPIIVPRDLSLLPWNVGYAETINSGKSKRNEDQARIHSSALEFQVSYNASETSNNVISVQSYKIPYKYFALFDGHAGSGAAVAAATSLHGIVHEKLLSVAHHFTQSGPFCEVSSNKGKGVLWFPNTNVTTETLIIGALESAFFEMDNTIEYENKHFDGVNGGKIYIANAGDSRAILCRRNMDAVALSNDFTPETERTRIRQLAAQSPMLLGGEFTSNEYLRRPVKKDLGSKILYRAAHMTDLKFPVVFGQGKRSRVLATIGVTRGFGDHDLSAHSTSARIKPFLSSQPEVKVLSMDELEIGEDDVIVMATDGLWDVTSNDVVASIVLSNNQFPADDPIRFKYRYTSAAQDLVMHARGKFTEKRNWRMNDGSAATIDDISVFVIPLWPYKTELLDINNVIQKVESDIENSTSSSISVPTHPIPGKNIHQPQINGVDTELASGISTDKKNNNSRDLVTSLESPIVTTNPDLPTSSSLRVPDEEDEPNH